MLQGFCAQNHCSYQKRKLIGAAEGSLSLLGALAQLCLRQVLHFTQEPNRGRGLCLPFTLMADLTLGLLSLPERYLIVTGAARTLCHFFGTFEIETCTFFFISVLLFPLLRSKDSAEF